MIGDRAYIARMTNAATSQLATYDISDPTAPVEVTSGNASFIGRAQDVAAEEGASVIGGGNLVAVGAGVGGTDYGSPSKIWLYDVTGDQATRVGAVSVS